MPFLKRLRSRTRATDEAQLPTVVPTQTENDYDAPPDSRAETPPPPFSFPTSYPVGGHNHKDPQGTLFLTQSDVLAHLRLLGAFDRLRKIVEDGTSGLVQKLDARSRWSFFVEVSVYRLELFLRALMATAHDGEMEMLLPPLDVCLVLHAYICNPFCFAEDMLRVYPVMRSLPQTLLHDVALAIDPTSLQLMVDPSMQSIWTSLTNTPFDPVLHFTSTTSRFTPDIDGFPSIEVPWLADDGTGYAQQGFRASSPDGTEYTHASLGIMKLASDMFRCKSDPLATLAGTVVSMWTLPEQPAGADAARWVATRMARTLEVQRASNPRDIAVALHFDRNAVEQMFQKALGFTKQFAFEGIMYRYRRGEAFSLHLAAAALRQSDNTTALDKLGWLRPEWIDRETDLLDRAIARYHGFMDMIAANPNLVAIPTVDIELTWSTHLLKPNYLADVKREVHRYVDHDAAIEESAIAQLFVETSEAWSARYNVPYSDCACSAFRSAFQPKQILTSLRSRANGTATVAAADIKAEYSAAGYADPNITHPIEFLCVTYVNHPAAQRARQKRAKEAAAQKKKATAAPGRPPCPLGSQSGGVFLKTIPYDVHFGLSGYATGTPNGLITHADLADPSVAPGPDAFGPYALAALGTRAALFGGGGKSSWGAGWQAMAIGGACTGGSFSM